MFLCCVSLLDTSWLDIKQALSEKAICFILAPVLSITPALNTLAKAALWQFGGNLKKYLLSLHLSHVKTHLKKSRYASEIEKTELHYKGIKRKSISCYPGFGDAWWCKGTRLDVSACFLTCSFGGCGRGWGCSTRCFARWDCQVPWALCLLHLWSPCYFMINAHTHTHICLCVCSVLLCLCSWQPLVFYLFALFSFLSFHIVFPFKNKMLLEQSDIPET